MTVRKGIPRLGKHCKEPASGHFVQRSLRDKLSRSCGEAQRKQAASLIRRECCCCEDGNCIVLDDGDTCTCPQTVSFSVCCKWFRWAVLPLNGTLEAEIFRDKDLKCCAVCGGVFVPKSNRAKYCPGCAVRVHRRQKTESERKRRSAVDS